MECYSKTKEHSKTIYQQYISGDKASIVTTILHSSGTTMERGMLQNSQGKRGKPPARKSLRLQRMLSKYAKYHVKADNGDATAGGKALKLPHYGEKRVVDLGGPKKLGGYIPTIKPGDIIQFPSQPFG